MLPGGCGERGPGRRGALPAEAAGLAGGCSVMLKALLQIPERLPICLAQELVCGRRAGKQTPAPSCGRAGGPLGPLGLGAGAGPKAQSQGRLDIPGEILAAASEETDWRILPGRVRASGSSGGPLPRGPSSSPSAEGGPHPLPASPLWPGDDCLKQPCLGYLLHTWQREKAGSRSATQGRPFSLGCSSREGAPCSPLCWGVQHRQARGGRPAEPHWELNVSGEARSRGLWGAGGPESDLLQ